MNAAFAGSHGVPVLLASGDSAAAAELSALLGAETVTTKTAETPASARLIHPEVVKERLREGVKTALERLDNDGYEVFDVGDPVVLRMRFTSTLHVDVLQSIPGVKKVDGYTIEYSARSASEAYRLIRLMYRFVSV